MLPRLWQHRSVARAAVAAMLIALAGTVALLPPLSSFNPSVPLSEASLTPSAGGRWTELWSNLPERQWMRCPWWSSQPPAAGLPAKSNGFLQVDCAGGLNQMRRDFCDGVGVAHLLNATLLLPQLEVSSFWNDTSAFAEVFDTKYFIKQMKGYVRVATEVVPHLISKAPTVVQCQKSKNKSLFDYTEVVLPILRKEKVVVIRPAASQRPDRHPLGAKAARCQACHQALRPVKKLRKVAAQLLRNMPRPFVALHLRFEPDMIAFSRCAYPDLSNTSRSAVDAARRSLGRSELAGDPAVAWRNRGKCPLTPSEAAFILRSLGFPRNMPIYLAAGGSLIEQSGFTQTFGNVFTKSELLAGETLQSLRGNSKAALDYLISLESDVYVATYFGNMDKMVVAARVLKGKRQTLVLNRKAFAIAKTSEGFKAKDVAATMWNVHKQAVETGRDLPLPDCFCECPIETGCSNQLQQNRYVSLAAHLK